MEDLQSNNISFKSFTAEQVESIKRSLLNRPKFSFRLQIILLFLITFSLTCGIIIADMIFISDLAKQEEFLDKAANFEFEIEQARRFEKNYFLYGTNLYDALEHLNNAITIKANCEDEMRLIIGDQTCNTISSNLNRYKESLEKLRTFALNSELDSPLDRVAIESEIRSSGSAIMANASSAFNQERLRLNSWLDTLKYRAVIALFFILIIGIILTTYINHQISTSYGRFEKYTDRISKGDFSLIVPKKRFRDEFTNLAIALNRMLLELKNRENELLQSHKMAAVGTLTAGIAHELNNPLNNISLITESLMDEYDEWDKKEKLKMLKDIFTQVERAGATVANLLDFTHRDDSSFVNVSINEVLERTLNFVENEINLNKVQLETELDRNLPQIKGNQHNLQQLFLNMILNALQAMPDGGKLSIKSYIQNNLIRIDISDSGVGISQENKEKIFDPFFTTKVVGEGTGLGLSVSYGIIKQHHGEIMVESEIGKGSTFSIKLPFV
jgi:two-component system, NtrC family, sensor kinase